MQFLIILIVASLVINNSLAEFPSDIQRCKAGDTPCIAKITTEILQNNPNGKSTLGLPSLEPFYINNFDVSQGESGGLSLQLKFRDIDVGGLSKISIEQVRGFTEDPQTSKFELIFFAPELTLKGKYTAGGRILIIPIQGDGNVNIILENVRISAKYKPTINNENGKLHLGVKKLKVLAEPSRMRIKFENLFNGDKVLGDNVNTFMNENWKDIWTEVSPAINTAIGKVVENVITSVFKKITYDEFYIKE